MSAKLSKIIAIVLSVVVIIAAVFSTVSLATSSILTKKLSSQDKFEEAYYKGSYTSGITIDEVEFGIMETVNLFKDINYILLVTRTQGHEQTIRDYEEKIKDIQKEYSEFVVEYTGDRDSDSFKRSCEEYEEKIEAVEKDIEKENKEFVEWRDSKYDIEDFEIVAEKLLTDKSFLNSIGTMYFIFSVGADEDEEVGREDYLGITVIDDNKYDLNDLEILTMLSEDAADYKYTGIALTVFAILGGILIAGLVLTIIIAVISLTIMIIKSIVKLLVNIKKSDDPKAVFGRNEFTSVGMTALVFALLIKLIYGAGVEIGSWATAVVILLIVNSVCSMVVNLIANKFNTTHIIKTVITGVSAVLAALLLVTVVNFGIANTALNKIYSYGETVFHSRYVEKCSDLLEERDDELSGYLEEGQISEYNSAISRLQYDAREYATEIVKSNDIRVIIIVCINLVLLVSAISLFGNVISRFAGAVFVAKGETVGQEYTESLISPVFAIATCVALCFFTISSVDQLEDSIRDSKYSVFVDEYQVEETVDYMLHEQLTESIDDSEELLDDLRDELNEIEDEDDKKNATATLDNLERKLNIQKNDLALVEDSNFSSVKAIALAAIILILEIGHKVLSKILGKKKEETPVEAAPAEPAVVVEEKPAVEAPVEAPVEETPVEEAPIEAPAEEATAEEAPTEE